MPQHALQVSDYVKPTIESVQQQSTATVKKLLTYLLLQDLLRKVNGESRSNA
jgi:hypothetical protein